MTGQGMTASFPRCSLEMKLSPALSTTIRWSFKENLESTGRHGHGSEPGITNTLVNDFPGIRVNDVLSDWGQLGKLVDKISQP